MISRHSTQFLTTSSSRWSTASDFDTTLLLGELACGIPLRQEGLVPLSAVPLAFPPGVGGGPKGISLLPSPLQPLCIGLPNYQLRYDVILWIGNASELVMQWLCWTEPLKSWHTLHLWPSRLRLYRVGFEGSQCHESPSGWTGASRPKPWWPLIRPLSTPSSTMPLPSGSPKCPQHTRTNLRWSRTRLWWSRPVAIKSPRCPISESRLGSSFWRWT